MKNMIQDATDTIVMMRVGVTSFYAARNGARRALRRLEGRFDAQDLETQNLYFEAVAHAANVLGQLEYEAEIDGDPRPSYRRKRDAFESLVYSYIDTELYFASL